MEDSAKDEDEENLFFYYYKWQEYENLLDVRLHINVITLRALANEFIDYFCSERFLKLPLSWIFLYFLPPYFL
jgi:hypothetical protein